MTPDGQIQNIILKTYLSVATPFIITLIQVGKNFS